MAGAVRAAMRGVRVAVTRLLNDAGTFSLISAMVGEKVSSKLSDNGESTHLVENHAAHGLDGDGALQLSRRSLSDEGVGGAVIGPEHDSRRRSRGRG